MQQYTWRSAASRARDRPPCLHARLEFASAACDRALRCFVYDTLAALRTTHACRLRAGSAVQRTCGNCNRSARSLWRRKLDLEENWVMALLKSGPESEGEESGPEMDEEECTFHEGDGAVFRQ